MNRRKETRVFSASIGCAALALLAATASTGACAQAVSDNPRVAFRVCDDRAFLAVSMARNYLMTGRNKDMVLPQLQGNPAAEAMANELFRRVEANEIKHPGQFAADVLMQCATEQQIEVGASGAAGHLLRPHRRAVSHAREPR